MSNAACSCFRRHHDVVRRGRGVLVLVLLMMLVIGGGQLVVDGFVAPPPPPSSLSLHSRTARQQQQMQYHHRHHLRQRQLHLYQPATGTTTCTLSTTSSTSCRVGTGALHLRRRQRATLSSSSTPRLSSSLSLSSLSTASGGSGSGSGSRFWNGKSAKQLLSVAIWCLLDVSFRQLFLQYNISFPSSLAGCGAVLAFLLALPRKLSDKLVTRRLEPGATLLAQYLPVFFVPSLIALPLADGFGSVAEMTKVGIVVVGGFLFTLWTTAASVLAVRKMVQQWQGLNDADHDDDLVNESTVSTARFIASSDGQIQQDPLQAMSAKAVEYAEKNRRITPVVFSRRLQRRLLIATTVMTAAASAAAHWIPLHSTQRSIRTSLGGIALLLSTLFSFVSSSRLPSKITKRIHPLLFTTSFTWAVAAWLATIGSGSTSFRSVLKYCYRGKASTASALAAGPILLYLLGPAVVSLSVSMYRRRQLIRDNVTEVATAVLVSTVGGLLGTAAAVRLLRLANPFLRLALLSRNITSPLAMAIAAILGADASLAVTMVVITGLLGANFGPSLLNQWGIKDPVARGLGMGAASHGLGTAALASAGPDEASAFPFAAIGMALCACAATIAVSIPPFRHLVLQVALGS